ncbi:MAG: hypothetical protein LH468_00570 [Nocardioides sp.]|nr:hypothetical protein [Nocardioides sp.]
MRGLLGDRVEDVRAERRLLPVARFASPEAFRNFFKATYGPTIAAYRNNADSPERAAELDAALVDLAAGDGAGDGDGDGDGDSDGAGDGAGDGDGAGAGAMGWEYLLLTARRRA